jgi:hypothetical protein
MTKEFKEFTEARRCLNCGAFLYANNRKQFCGRRCREEFEASKDKK